MLAMEAALGGVFVYLHSLGKQEKMFFDRQVAAFKKVKKFYLF